MKLTREQRQACFDGRWPRITYPAGKPCPVEVGERYWLSNLCELVVTKVRRARTGEWVLVYEVHRREPALYMAVRSPRATTPKEREEFTEVQARGYTHSRSNALDPQAGAVYFDGDNDPILVDARKRFAEQRQSEAKVEQTEENARQVARQLRDLAVAIHRSGGDPVEFLAGVQRQIAVKRDELRDAA